MGAGISFVTRVSTLPRVILGLDPGIRCIGGAGEDVGGVEWATSTTSAVHVETLQIPGSSPRMTRWGCGSGAGYAPMKDNWRHWLRVMEKMPPVR
jgi:hypothetical protein